MKKCIIQISLFGAFIFSLNACHQKSTLAPLESSATQFELDDIKTSYYAALVDTVLNHSKFKFEETEKQDVIFYYEQDSFFKKQIPVLINSALVSKRHCENLLGNKAIPHKLRIIYFNDREKLRPFLNMAPKGYALPDAHTLLIATNDSLRAYHTHELMHIISISQFGGYAASPADWIQEGLSVFADNPCMNYSIHSIAANLLFSNMHSSFDSIFYHFRVLPDLAGYMQAGSLVQYFIENYGIERFSILWQKGIGELKQIINVSPDDFEKAYYAFLRATYKQKPEIDWELLNKKGCG